MCCRWRHLASIRKTIAIRTNRTKPTDRQIATTARRVMTLNPQQPCNSSRVVYLPENVDGYDRDDDGNHNHPVNIVGCDCPLLEQITTDPGGGGGSQYSLLIVSLADTSSPPGTSSLAALAATVREDPNGNNDPSSCQCARSPTPTLLVPPPDRRCRHCICNHYV